MSLINDALRKARQAAAEHEERRPDGAFQRPRAYPSRSPRRGMGMAAVVLVAALAAVGGAALVWWALNRAEQPVNANLGRPVELPRQATEDPEPAPVHQTTDPAPGTAPTDPPDRLEESAVPADPPVQNPTGVSPSPTVVPQPTGETVVTNEQGERERVYVLDADLGNVTLNLGYIVARTTNPFAEINGIEVLMGSEIEGFVVEKIEPDRVVLRDKNGLLVLRVP